MAKQTEYEIQPSTIETIDRAFFTWLKEEMNVHTTTNKGWNKVPVVWLASERNFHIKHDKDLRDSKGVLKLPLISIEKVTMAKDLTNKGGYYAAIPAGTDYKGRALTISRRINQLKSSKYAHNDAKSRGLNNTDKPKGAYVRGPYETGTVYENISIPLPTYINVQYSVIIRADYQQQMNEIISAFYTVPNSSALNSFFVCADGHCYEVFLDGNFGQANNTTSIGDSEKVYQSNLTFRVQGYILGAEKNDSMPKVVVRENKVDVVMLRERVMIGEIPQYPTSVESDPDPNDDADSSEVSEETDD
tara:strand:+ start:3529 stop:4437 length:909 start_codon:yes stop_codon:yes gene_type:complete